MLYLILTYLLEEEEETGVIHNTIGPTIASKKMTLATISHNEAYVYNP